jgi:hypothetical protein
MIGKRDWDVMSFFPPNIENYAQNVERIQLGEVKCVATQLNQQ